MAETPKYEAPKKVEAPKKKRRYRPRRRHVVAAAVVAVVGTIGGVKATTGCGCSTPSYGVPPTATITAPSGSQPISVSGASVTLTATASPTSPATIAGVQFLIDGVPTGAEDTSSPFTITWDSTGATNGNHNLTATARDSNGLTGTSATTVLSVSNGSPGALNANVWVSPTGSDVGANCAYAGSAGAAPGAANTLCATPQKACTLVPSGTATIGIQAGDYTSGFNVSCTPASTVTFTIPSAAFVHFDAQSTLTGSGYVLQGTTVGNGVGFSLGQTIVNGTGLTLNNINLYCQASSPWATVGDSTGTWCNTQVIMAGTNNTWNGGDQSNWAQCTPRSGPPAYVCTHGQAANNQVNSGSGLLVENMRFHDFFIFNSGDHSEFWKLNGGSNVSFLNNEFYHCAPPSGFAFGVPGCNSAMVFVGASGSNNTINNLTFNQNLLASGGLSAGPAFASGYNQPHGTEYTMTFLYNSSDKGFSLCDRSTANLCSGSSLITGSNVTYAGNAFGQASFGGCFSAGTYSHNVWFTLTSSTAAKCSAGTDTQLTNTTLATMFTSANAYPPNMTPTPSTSPLLAAGENTLCPATDIFGTTRPHPSPACDAGAVQH